MYMSNGYRLNSYQIGKESKLSAMFSDFKVPFLADYARSSPNPTIDI